MYRHLIWVALAAAVILPIAAAATSPYLAWRSPIYIAAGFAGILGLALLLIQPVLIAGLLTGLSPRRARQVHRVFGAVLVATVLVHVAALWVTSPPDVVDALLFASPTPFSVWGVIAMWALLASGWVALFRRRLKMGPRAWRTVHLTFAVIIVPGTVAHALLIEGTMEPVTKVLLCTLAVTATAWALASALRTRQPRA